MKKFVVSPEFAALNVGFALDEGLASPDDSFSLYYGERTPRRELHLTISYKVILNLFLFL